MTYFQFMALANLQVAAIFGPDNTGSWLCMGIGLLMAGCAVHQFFTKEGTK